MLKQIHRRRPFCADAYARRALHAGDDAAHVMQRDDCCRVLDATGVVGDKQLAQATVEHQMGGSGGRHVGQDLRHVLVHDVAGGQLGVVSVDGARHMLVADPAHHVGVFVQHNQRGDVALDQQAGDVLQRRILTARGHTDLHQVTDEGGGHGKRLSRCRFRNRAWVRRWPASR